jgi:hypothetical protein
MSNDNAAGILVPLAANSGLECLGTACFATHNKPAAKRYPLPLRGRLDVLEIGLLALVSCRQAIPVAPHASVFHETLCETHFR